MIALTQLWLPIVLSAVAVFVASSIVWMALPYHKSDWSKLKNEDAFMEAVRAHTSGGGMYMFPNCMGPEMKTPEGQARFKKGPWGNLIVIGSTPSMGRSLGLWFLYLLIVALLDAYVLGHTLKAGDSFHTVLRIASAVAWLAYSGGALPDAIWKGHPWSTMWKNLFDGLIYATITGALFAKFWPAAAAS